MAIARRDFLKAGMIAAAGTLCSLRGEAHEPGMEGDLQSGAAQIAIPRVDRMPNIPSPYKMRDWRQAAVDLDAYAFDLNAKGPSLPLVWIDKSHVNFDEDTFGLYSTVDDPRAGPIENKGQYHDAICDMPAVIGATLVGIDKRNQGGRNWVSMSKAYFGKASGQNVFMTFERDFSYKVGNGLGIDFWVDTLPTMFFSQLVDQYPHEPQFEQLMRTSAEQFYRAVVVLKNDPKKFHHQSFNFAEMKPYDGTGDMHWLEPESSAAFGWVEYMAFAKFRDRKFLDAATWAMDALNADTDNPHYACILPFGAYLAARMNAEQGTKYDTARIVNWCFEGGHTCVGGVAAARWGEYDVSGLVTMYDDRPYLFETFQMGSAIVPLVRYEPRLARAVGKWMLNAANSARLFYPGELPDEYQVAADLRSVSKNLIAYEVLLGRDAKHLTPIEARLFDNRPGAPFVAARDNWDSFSPVTGERYVFPKVSNFSVYSSTSVGVFGSIIARTDDEKILQLDCLKTDFFHEAAYPTHLYFNPYGYPKEIRIDVGSRPVDLYDAVTKRWIKKGDQRDVAIRLAADSAAVVVRVPAGAKLERRGARLIADGVTVDYSAG
jgi:hypothetical protein